MGIWRGVGKTRGSRRQGNCPWDVKKKKRKEKKRKERKLCVCVCGGGSVIVVVGRGVALLEKVLHCGSRLWDALATCLRRIFFCLPSEQDVELSASPVPCLPGCCHVPTLMIVD
jgi:hypothetical protein